MTTRDAWPQAQALMSESKHGKAGMQSRQHMQPGTASMHCNQSMCTGPIGAGYKRRGVVREESRLAWMIGLCTRCQGSTARKDGEGHTVVVPFVSGLLVGWSLFFA